MEGWRIGVAIFSGIAVAQGFFLGGYLMVKEKFKASPNFFLGLMILGIAVRIGKSVFYYLIPGMAKFGMALGGAGLWAIGPSLWLYTKTSRQGNLDQWDYLYYVPSLTLLFLGVTIDGSHFSTIYELGYLVLTFFLMASTWVFKNGRWNKNERRFRLFLIGVSLILGSFISAWMAGNIQWYAISSAFAAAVLYGMSFFIWLDREILQEPIDVPEVKKSNSAPNGNSLNGEVQKGIAAQLEKLFSGEKIYRQKGLTIAAVASEIGRPSYLVSKVINQHFGLKFNEFVNRYRVEEVKAHLRDQERNPTVETIAKEVGFSSTSSMYHAFKRETNLTPQAFRKEKK